MALNKANLTKAKKTSQMRQKFDFGMEPKVQHFFPHVSRYHCYAFGLLL